jgi:hypothetical protein
LKTRKRYRSALISENTTAFQTKDEARDSKVDIVQRLDRIENKVDELRAMK